MTETSTEKKRSFDTYDTRVDKVDLLAPRVKNIHFSIQGGKSIDFKAGQFVQMFIPQPDKVRRTSYSIASPPSNHNGFDLCVTHVEGGVSSTHLHGLNVGDSIQAMGPLGKFTMPEAPPRDVVFIATGSGIAPFRSMINDCFDRGVKNNISLIFGNRFEPDILYREEWANLAAKHKTFKVLLTLSRGAESWQGERGYVQEKIAGFVPTPRDNDYYICGLTKMIEGVQEKLLEVGVPEGQIHYERYD